METSNIHGTRKTGAEIPAKAPLPLASKKELATKPKKTAPPRSPSRLGESAVNTASRPGAEKGIASADGSAKDKGKRTELRIKPRQKRGLLVASELPKQAKRPKVRKVSDEGSGHASLGTVGQVPLDSHKPGTETEQASPCPEDEDPFAYSPIRALKGNGAERRSKSPSPRSKRKGARDVAADSVVAVGPVARKKTAPSPREDEDPFASSPAVLGGRTARKRPSRSPLSVSKQNTNAMGSLRASTSPRRATALTGDRPVVVTGRSTAAMYDMPDDTDDEYFGILPTPVQGREDLVPARRSAKAATKKSSKSVKPMVFRSSSPDMDASSHSPRPISRGGDMQKNGTRSPSVQIESSEEDLPRARRRVRRPVNDEEFPQLPVGPRLARLGRNVKSKEVIGYVRLNSPDEEEQEASPAASERGHPGGFSPTTGNFSPDWSVSRESATAKRVASPVEDTPSRLEGYEESTAVVLGRSAAASAGSRAAVVLRRQNSLPETTRLPGLNEHARGGRKSPDGQASRPGLTRHRSVVTAEEYETEGILAPTTAAARIVQAVTHGKVDLPVADPPPAIEVGNSATGQNAVQLAPHQPDDLPQHRLKPGNATCSIKPVCTTGGVVGGAPSDESPVTVPSNPPRIVNPATRGRKAALKSHAAGQVPQSILPPTDPVPARLVARSGPETRQGPSGNERPKRKMTFPGFMSAKGQGPWSREAHDLLDRGHPLS
ncbi:hypothetical protein B0T14DRAFT_81961 [Immersiella caudata]|uniref:Uncharacterized protein n=1 Tax=Immersiella caudata TaxID=314043 RepID=A0AA39XGV3_9PEZI|nr:hypothetical protein B0T14DRAFT_81961 [Immersiella caudata]